MVGMTLLVSARPFTPFLVFKNNNKRAWTTGVGGWEAEIDTLPIGWVSYGRWPGRCDCKGRNGSRQKAEKHDKRTAATAEGESLLKWEKGKEAR